MKMKETLLGILATSAILSDTRHIPYRPSKYDAPPNGNSRRTHKENVIRRKKRRLQKQGRKNSLS